MSDKPTPKGKPGRKAALDPMRHEQPDLFVADILDVMPKGDSASMEHPVFALRPADKTIRKYGLCCKLFSRIDVCLSLVTVMLRVPQRPGMAIDCR